MSYKSEFLIDVQARKSGGAFPALQQEMRQTANAGGSAVASLKGAWLQVAAGVMAAQAAIGAVKTAFASLGEGAAQAQLSTAFRSMHADSEALLQSMRAASGFAAKDDALKVLANRWKAAGKDIADLNRVLPIAAKAAVATQKDMAQVAQDLAMALEKGEAGALGQYVGAIDLAKAYDAFAKSANRSVASMTEFDKKRAVAQEGLRLMEERFGRVVVDIDAQRLQQLETAFDNVANRFKESLARGVSEVAFGMMQGPQKMLAEQMQSLTFADEQRTLIGRVNSKERQQMALDEAAGISKLKDGLVDLQEWQSAVAMSKTTTSPEIGEKAMISLLEGRIAKMRIMGEISQDTAMRMLSVVERAKEAGVKGDEILARLLGVRNATIQAYMGTLTAEAQKQAELVASLRPRMEEFAKTTEEIVKRVHDANKARFDNLTSYYSMSAELANLEIKGRSNLNVIEQARLVWLNQQLAVLGQSVGLSERIEMAVMAVKGSDAYKMLSAVGGKAQEWWQGLGKAKPAAKGKGGGSGATEAKDITDAQRDLRIEIAGTTDEFERQALVYQQDYAAIEAALASGSIKQNEYIARMAELDARWQETVQGRIGPMLESVESTSAKIMELDTNLSNARIEMANSVVAAQAEAERARFTAMIESSDAAYAHLSDTFSKLGSEGWEFANQLAEASNYAAEATKAFAMAATQEGTAWRSSMGSAIGASAKATAAFMKDKKARYLLSGLGEVAEAIGSAASYDYWGAAMHTLAAGAFFYAAGKGGASGASSKGSATSTSRPAALSDTAMQSAPAQNVTINMRGFAVGSDAELGKHLGNALNSAAGTVRLDKRLQGQAVMGY